MYKEDLALNNLKGLICYKTKTNQIRNLLSLRLNTAQHSNYNIKIIYIIPLSNSPMSQQIDEMDEDARNLSLKLMNLPGVIIVTYIFRVSATNYFGF